VKIYFGRRGSQDSRFYCIPMIKWLSNQLKNWWRLCSTTSLTDEQKIRMVRRSLPETHSKMQAPPPSEKGRVRRGRGTNLVKCFFANHKRENLVGILIMVRQIFNFISESGDPRSTATRQTRSNPFPRKIK
jgi:hypothetical protein